MRLAEIRQSLVVVARKYSPVEAGAAGCLCSRLVLPRVLGLSVETLFSLPALSEQKTLVCLFVISHQDQFRPALTGFMWPPESHFYVKQLAQTFKRSPQK